MKYYMISENFSGNLCDNNLTKTKFKTLEEAEANIPSEEEVKEFFRKEKDTRAKKLTEDDYEEFQLDEFDDENEEINTLLIMRYNYQK